MNVILLSVQYVNRWSLMNSEPLSEQCRCRHCSDNADFLIMPTLPRESLSVNGHLFLPLGGQQKCPLVATRTARSWPTDLPTGVSVALALAMVVV